MSKSPWIEQYRPMQVNELKQSPDILKLLRNIIATGNLTHHIFYGPPGTGKTSAIIALGRELFGEQYDKRVIEFNASNDRGINAVRDKITNAAKIYVGNITRKDGTVIPPYKLIILDEADCMTSDAQDALRVIIEKYSGVARFCFICNYICRITDAIKSRCVPIFFNKLDKQSMQDRLSEISQKENINISPDILDSIIDVSEGDMRKAIVILQNLKFRNDYLMSLRRPIDTTRTIISYMPQSLDITREDIYRISTSISPEKAKNLLSEILECTNNKDVIDICKQLNSSGIPIDNILNKLQEAIIDTKHIEENDKLNILHANSVVFYNLKESCNGYIQSVYYVSNIRKFITHIN